MSKTALMFAGQGAQTVGMGKDFAARFPSAREWFERGNTVLGYDLARICFEGPEGELTKTENAQPAIFLVGWVAFQLLLELVPSFKFHATAGLSLGEFTALAAAGVLSFEDSLRLVRERGQYMQEASAAAPGGMAAIVGLDEAAAREISTEAGVELANLNCPGQIVVSGPTERIAAACELAKSRGARRALPLSVAGAFHSSLMAGAQPKLHEALASVPIDVPLMRVISNVTARPHAAPTDIRQRLVEQLTSPVRWEASIRYLLAEGFSRFIELGPGKALSGFVKRIDSKVQILNVADVPSLESTAKQLSET